MEQAELLAKLEAVLKGHGVPDGLTVEDVRQRFLKVKGRVSDKTRTQYEWMFAKVAAYSPTWPRDAAEVNQFISSLDGLGDVSVLQLFKCLRVVCAYCAKTYGWPDPTAKAERPKVEHKRRRYLSKDELALVVSACRDPREKALILALLDSSARVGELASLRVSGLGPNYLTVVGKTGQRRYRCDPRLVGLLHEVAVGDVVFPMKVAGSRDRIMEPVRPSRSDSLSAQVNAIMRRAGLTGDKLGPHTLRHTAASLVAKETMSALAVRAILQHDSVKTSEIYIHDVEDTIQQQVSPLELAGVVVGPSESQLALSDGRRTLALASGTETAVSVAGLVEGLFPVVPDGVKVRPSLDSNDLGLIRDAFVELMRARNEAGSGSRCVQLMRRMLRKA